MEFKSSIKGLYNNIRNYSLKPKPVIITYLNALHQEGIGGVKGRKIRHKIENLPEPERGRNLRRFHALDEIFLLKEAISEI